MRSENLRLIVMALTVSVLMMACGGAGDEGATPEDAQRVEASDSGVESDDTVDTPDGSATEPEPAEQPESTAVPEPTATPEPEPTATPEPELLAISDVGDGPYAIGAATITITDESRDRPLTVEVWFPLVDGTDAEVARYTFVTGDYFESERAVAAPATAASPGPFPMVVYSHGSGGLRYIHSDYTETLASHGYVVVAPDHTGNTAIERVLNSSDDVAVIALNRPLDVIAVIDAMTDPTDEETAGFSGLVDPEHIAVTGHSFGGFTTYAVAAGYDNPQGSAPLDERVGALIPLAPAVGDGGETSLLSAEDLGRIEVPTLVIVGTDDKTTPVDPHVETAWTESSASPHYRLELVAGEHQTFTDLCRYRDVLNDREDATPLVVDTIEAMAVEGCSPGDMPIERAQALTNTFAVTFLASVFADGEMISADTHEIPADISFDVKD